MNHVIRLVSNQDHTTSAANTKFCSKNVKSRGQNSGHNTHHQAAQEDRHCSLLHLPQLQLVQNWSHCHVPYSYQKHSCIDIRSHESMKHINEMTTRLIVEKIENNFMNNTSKTKTVHNTLTTPQPQLTSVSVNMSRQQRQNY